MRGPTTSPSSGSPAGYRARRRPRNSGSCCWRADGPTGGHRPVVSTGPPSRRVCCTSPSRARTSTTWPGSTPRCSVSRSARRPRWTRTSGGRWSSAGRPWRMPARCPEPAGRGVRCVRRFDGCGLGDGARCWSAGADRPVVPGGLGALGHGEPDQPCVRAVRTERGRGLGTVVVAGRRAPSRARAAVGGLYGGAGGGRQSEPLHRSRHRDRFVRRSVPVRPRHPVRGRCGRLCPR